MPPCQQCLRAKNQRKDDGMNYLETTKDFYREAALEPDKGLCCTTSPVWAVDVLLRRRRVLLRQNICPERRGGV